MKIQMSVAVLGVFMLLGVALPSEAKSKFGITVQECRFDFDDDDFCSDKMMKRFAQVMEKRPANFVDNQLLYIYGGKHFYRMVVMDKQKKTVRPFHWGFSATETQPEVVFKFDKQSPYFCVHGNIDAYRDSYSYDGKPFCFRYTGKGSYAGFKRFEQ